MMVQRKRAIAGSSRYRRERYTLSHRCPMIVAGDGKITQI